jgi:ribosome-binding ATPase
MGFSCGIVGLPNVGKSTIFNALTSGKAASANFPFCTIEPNTGAVAVPDERLHTLSRIGKSEKVIPTQLTFVDIAGLIRGASKGEGLGNQFLGHIRSTEAVAHVVRCFEDENVTHVDGSTDPVRDLDTIMTELVLSDYESVIRQREKQEKEARSKKADALTLLESLQALENHLATGAPARTFQVNEDAEQLSLIHRQLLTAKPAMIIANVDEEMIRNGYVAPASTPLAQLEQYARTNGYPVVRICGKIEAEIAEFDPEERKEYLAQYGATESGLTGLTVAGYALLGLMTYFTCGPKETRAWTIENGTKAPQGARKIHTDFEKNFIRAEVISYEDYVQCNGEVKAKEAGKMRVEGREYVMQDGDVVFFRIGG